MKKEYKIAIAFYGITRSLKYTIKSIQENIIYPAKENGNTKVFCHFFNQGRIENPRTHESGTLDINEWKLLNPDVNLIEKIDDHKENLLYDELIQYGNAWEDEGQSLRNILRQLLSLHKVTQLIKEDGQFDIIIFARPDMIYHDSFDEIIKKHKIYRNKISLPFWAWGGGLNDRFAICNQATFEAYGERIVKVTDYCKNKNRPMHSERLLMYSLQKSTSQLNLIPIKATRVRSNGSHAQEFFKEVKIAKKIEAFLLCNCLTVINKILGKLF